MCTQGHPVWRGAVGRQGCTEVMCTVGNRELPWDPLL
jgi:hypothetical protein